MVTATDLGASGAAAAVAIFDARPFFEKALQFGIQNKILDASRLEQIAADAPKGIVQIARYFGSEFLRPELERARERMVNLVSLYLESSCQGSLKRAAESLRDHSFLSRSKGGSDMLKALIAMPSNSHFGMNENTGFTDEHIPLLAKWSLRSLADYQVEIAQRSQAEAILEAAVWLADELGLDEAELQEAGCDGEAVIRTSLLALSAKSLKISRMPDWLAFEKLIVALRKKPFELKMPAQLPKALQAVVTSVQQSILADWPKLTDSALPVKKLFQQTPAFVGRYFWVEDSLAEVDQFDRSVSEAWHHATGGHEDEGSLLTLFLTLAAGGPAKTLLTEKAASTLIRKIRKNKVLKSEIASDFIRDHAPAEHQADYAELWQSFLDDGLTTLQSDFDYQLNDALALLRRECNLK
jgi:hypothetical protein